MKCAEQRQPARRVTHVGDRQGERVNLNSDNGQRCATKRALLFARWVVALQLDELAGDRAEAAIWQALTRDLEASPSDRALARARLAASEYLDVRRETRIAREVARVRLMLVAK